MKQINISVSFDDEKLRALNKYLKKKELTAEAELTAALLHLYEKHVPAAVREYIDEDDVVVPAKPKRTVKPAAPKKVEEPIRSNIFITAIARKIPTPTATVQISVLLGIDAT